MEKSALVATLLVIVVGFCVGFGSAGTPVEREATPTNTLLAALVGANPRAVGSEGGGSTCAACTLIVALVEQYTEIHNKTVIHAMEELCSFLPDFLQKICVQAVDYFGPRIIDALEKKFTPDLVCRDLGICTDAQCHLFPLPSAHIQKEFEKQKLEGTWAPVETPEEWTPGEWIDRFINFHDPLFDFDHDNFSTAETFRGYNWRGRDCDDVKKDIYPGRKNTTHDDSIDHDCNGISGPGMEEKLCGSTPRHGWAVVGDSAAAHFHVPPEYITAADINSVTYDELLTILSNEFDWPMMSSTTGYTYSDWTGHPKGPVSSMYLKAVENNRCLHRDYQNIGVNGARTSSMADNVMFSLARDQENDHPLFLSYALIGNDVCNGHPGLGHMTTPEEFYANVVKAMQFFDTILPNNSYVVFMGLADGRILWDSMHNRTHPIGQYRNDVTYADLYAYLNCLEISPCWGWLNNDSYWRNQTSERAANLSAVYADVIKNNTFKNFNMTYTENPIKAIAEEWVKSGHETWELIEPVDGFHPNQMANALVADYLWNEYKQKFPYLIQQVNPNNEEIIKLFGDQGGY